MTVIDRQTPLEQGAASGIEGLAGNPACVIGYQECDHAGNVIGGPNPIQRRASRSGSPCRFVRAQPPGVEVSVDRTRIDRVDRVDRVDRDGPRPEVLGERRGEHVDRRFGHRVGDQPRIGVAKV